MSEGEQVCLPGPNGTGKTTLLRTVLGLHPSLQVKVALLDRDLGELNRQVWARLVSMVFPGRLLAGHSVQELVALGRLPCPGSKSMAGTWILRVPAERAPASGRSWLVVA